MSTRPATSFWQLTHSTVDVLRISSTDASAADSGHWTVPINTLVDYSVALALHAAENVLYDASNWWSIAVSRCALSSISQ